jgi:hypothetical protein
VTRLYFYSATSLDGTTYFSVDWGDHDGQPRSAPTRWRSPSFRPVASRRGDILYVDGLDGGGVQNYYDGAFTMLIATWSTASTCVVRRRV